MGRAYLIHTHDYSGGANSGEDVKQFTHGHVVKEKRPEHIHIGLDTIAWPQGMNRLWHSGREEKKMDVKEWLRIDHDVGDDAFHGLRVRTEDWKWVKEYIHYLRKGLWEIANSPKYKMEVDLKERAQQYYEGTAP